MYIITAVHLLRLVFAIVRTPDCGVPATPHSSWLLGQHEFTCADKRHSVVKGEGRELFCVYRLNPD